MGEFVIYLLGVGLLVGGLATFVLGILKDQLVPTVGGFVFVVWGGCLMEGVSLRDLIAVFHRDR